MIILIPAYQPDRKLIDLVTSIGAAAPGVVVLVVDDGSGPVYRPVFAAVQRQGHRVVGYDTNQGKGFALKTGFALIAREFPGQDVVCADCDGQHAVGDILRVVQRVRTGGTAMVLGTRSFTGDVPARSRVGNTDDPVVVPAEHRPLDRRHADRATRLPVIDARLARDDRW